MTFQNHNHAFLKSFDLGTFKLLFGNVPPLHPVTTLNIRSLSTAHRVYPGFSFVCSLDRACTYVIFESLSQLSRRLPLLYSISSLPGGGRMSFHERSKAAVALGRMENHGDCPFPGTYLSSAKITITKPPLCRREWHSWTVSETSLAHVVVSEIHAEGRFSVM